MPANEEEQADAIPEWVVTFGDMMSLLLTFFVLLFSMSEIKEEQQQALIDSLRRQFGHVTASLSPIPGPGPPMNSAIQRLSSMGRARRANTMNGGDKVRAPVGDHPPLRAARSGNRTSTGGILDFKQGQGVMDPEIRRKLGDIAEVIRGKPQKIEIRGHTSRRPLDESSPYRNHWDLAYARSFRVMEHLVDLGIDPERIRIVVAAKNEPAQPNATDPAHDRVEVFMLNEFVDATDRAEENALPFLPSSPE
jgi:chemotaxis protein MotB